MMSTQTKIHIPMGILYRWMYPTVNPYSCGDGSVFTCVPMGRLASISSRTDLTRQQYYRFRPGGACHQKVSYGQRLDLTHCRSHQRPSSCLARIIHDGSWRNRAVATRDRRAEPRGKEAYLKQYVDRPNGEPACLDAVPTASRLVAAANPRLQQKRS
jgi:hypothetical protein